MKLAIVHDWFSDFAGSEKCIESFTNLYPEADIFSLVDFMDETDRQAVLKGKKAKTTFIQNLPFSQKLFRNYLSLFPRAIEEIDLRGYDVILSSSHAFAKGILCNTEQLHICYCHTPIRYAWDLYHQYLDEAGLKKGLKAWYVKRTLHNIRLWDSTTANRVNHFIANSGHIAKRINKIYGKKADVIYPPVDIDKFELCAEKEDYYLIAARFVPYKKVNLVIEAFTRMPDKKLIVVSGVQDIKKAGIKVTKNIELLDFLPFEELKNYMQKAKAFLFAAEEDFGITIVEAQACGTPVIAFKVGGASETVIDGKTGIHFDEQTPESIVKAVNKFEESASAFDPESISRHAARFSRAIFEKKINNYILDKFEKFRE